MSFMNKKSKSIRHFLCWPENCVLQKQQVTRTCYLSVMTSKLCLWKFRKCGLHDFFCTDLKTVSFRNWVSHASRPGTMLTSPPYIVTSKLKVGIPTRATCIPPMHGSSSNNGLQIILALPLIVILSIPACTNLWACTILLASVRSQT